MSTDARRESVIMRLARLSDPAWARLWLDDDSPLAVVPDMLALADEAVAVRGLRQTERRYRARARGCWLWVPWAEDRARDLLGRGLTPGAVLERLAEPARCRGLFPHELRAAIDAEARRAKVRAA